MLCCPLVSCCPRPLHGVPCLRIRSGTSHCLVPLCVAFPRVVLSVLLLCVVVLCVENGRVVCVVCGLVVNVVFPSFFLLPCVRCYSIVGLVLCLCDRVVSLWNSGDGLCGWKGVWCLLFAVSFLCVVVCVSVWCVCCGLWNGGVCGLWNGGVCGGCVVSLLVSLFLFLFFFLFVLVFGVVRAQLCEHARNPRTPLCLPCC